jgi:uncharacterized protein (TIGR03083 family)
VQQPPLDVMVRHIIQAARDELAVLVQEQRAGGEAAWNAPTYCPGWQAHDAIAHLRMVPAVFEEQLRPIVAGTPPPPFDPERPRALVARFAALPREELLADLERAYAEDFAFYEGLDAAVLERPVPLPFGTLPLGHTAAIRLSELAIHHWDIRAGVDPRARLTPEAVPLLAAILTMAVGALAHGEKTDGVWQLDVDAPGSGPLTLRVQGDQVSAAPGRAERPDARLALDGDAWVRLGWGRLDLAAEIERGRVRVEGDRARALALQRLFTGV